MIPKVYFWKEKSNFGDRLTALLLRKFSRLASEWAPPEEAELVVVGSVLDKLPDGWSGVIAGAGKLHEKTVLNLPSAKVLAVRGPLSARGLRGDFVLADAALLADELVRLEDKQYDLGIVPHWTDKTLEVDPRFTKYNPKIIHVDADPLSVISEIGRCKKIVSSSLHGIILADAFGIPRRIEIAPRMLTHSHQEGGIFKWTDYELSLGRKFTPGVTVEIDRNLIAEKQHALFDVFLEVAEIFG